MPIRNYLAAGLAAVSLSWGIVPALADEPIRIVVAGPITGPVAAFGDQMLRGARAAVEDINATGGVDGRQLELVVEDDQCDPKQAVSVANRVVAADQAAVIGHACSGATLPASEVYAEAQVPMITPISTNPLITERGDAFANVFRVVNRDDKEGVVAGDYIAKAYAGKKVAVLDDKGAYGQGIADEVRKRLKELNVPLTLSESFNPGEKDYAAMVLRLKAAGIDAIFIGGHPTEVGLIVRQAKELGYSPAVMGGNALSTNELVLVSGGTSDGVMFTSVADARRNPAAASVLERFRKSGYDPEGFTLYTYAAVQAVAQAMDAANSIGHAEVIKAMKEGQFHTVIGDIRFDEKGDLTKAPTMLFRWSGNEYEPLD